MPQTLEDLEKLKHAPAVPGVEDLFLRRWSPRALADKAVSTEDLKKIFEAARWAASSYNEQPWRFFLGRRGDATYQKIFDVLVEFNQGWAKSAPVLIPWLTIWITAPSSASSFPAKTPRSTKPMWLTLV